MPPQGDLPRRHADFRDAVLTETASSSALHYRPRLYTQLYQGLYSHVIQVVNKLQSNIKQQVILETCNFELICLAKEDRVLVSMWRPCVIMMTCYF